MCWFTLLVLTLYIIVPAVVDYNTITVIMESGNFLWITRRLIVINKDYIFYLHIIRCKQGHMSQNMMLLAHKCSVVHVAFLLNLRNSHLEIYLILPGHPVTAVCVSPPDNTNLHPGALFNSFYSRPCLRNS